jgi:hypothetical protein
VYFKRFNTKYGTFTRKKGLCVFWTSMPSELMKIITTKLKSFGIEFADTAEIKSAMQAFYDERFVPTEADQTTSQENEADQSTPKKDEAYQTTPQKNDADQTTPGKGTAANPIAGPSTPHSSKKKTMGGVNTMNMKTMKTPLGGKRINCVEDKPNNIKKARRLGRCASSEDGTNSTSHDDLDKDASGSGR